MNNLSEVRIYVGTYAKYNNGSIFGKWFDLSDFSGSEEFYNACRELHSDEEDPKLMFQNYENIPDRLIDESWLAPNIFEIIESISKLGEMYQEAFNLWCNYTSFDIVSEDTDELITSFEDDYLGAYKDEEDFAYNLVEDTYDLPGFAKTYFDYKKLARDLFVSKYRFEDGHVFIRG